MVKRSSLCQSRWVLVVLMAVYIQNVTSFWEYAVSTKSKIMLFDKQWTQLQLAIGRNDLKQMRALAYDPVSDTIFFSAQGSPTASIFSVKVTENAVQLPKELKLREKNEYIEDLVFDFYKSELYYSDSGNNRIGKLIFDRSKNIESSHGTFLNVTGEVSGLEFDSCKRNLYYSIVSRNKQSINVVSVEEKETKPKILKFEKEHYSPIAMALDHLKRRIYVADVEKYNSYSIDSILANGSDFRTEISERNVMPRSIAVDDTYVYFVEGNAQVLRRFEKSDSGGSSEKFVDNLSEPFYVMVRHNYLEDLDPAVCEVNPQKLEELKKAKLKTEEPSLKRLCVFGKKFNEKTLKCDCGDNFEGKHCEIDLCYNFCMNGGVCSVNYNSETKKREPTCSCKNEFGGDHCELDMCRNFCLNNGTCNAGKVSTCQCNEGFSGARCEFTTIDSTTLLIDTKTIAYSTKTEETSTVQVPESTEHEESSSEHISSFLHHAKECEPNNIKQSYIILAVCFTISLLLFLVILVVVKKMNKQLRPRIRKKYVVHKNIEPLTHRPMTEQCEVIIEDCCNMNICETPCFDPKLLQQEINESNLSVTLTTSKKCSGSNKEDKQDLLKNMEFNQ